jgi:DNA-binding CsgD family transcriptional regulator
MVLHMTIIDAAVRRDRGHGPDEPGGSRQCVPGDGATPHLLSPSELGVLCAAASGLTSSASARQLGKGAETVKSQRHQIILKLGARNISHAVALATARRIVALAPAGTDAAA